MKTVDLIKAAAEMNYVMGLHYPIEIPTNTQHKELTNDEINDLKIYLWKAVELILPDDQFSYSTKETIEQIRQEHIQQRQKGNIKTYTNVEFGVQHIEITSDRKKRTITISSNLPIKISPNGLNSIIIRLWNI
jgi:hypothetical protein